MSADVRAWGRPAADGARVELAVCRACLDRSTSVRQRLYAVDPFLAEPSFDLRVRLADESRHLADVPWIQRPGRGVSKAHVVLRQLDQIADLPSVPNLFPLPFLPRHNSRQSFPLLGTRLSRPGGTVD